MGGQACVLYGAAEFSRNLDLVLPCDPENLARLAAALQALGARTIAVPPFDRQWLDQGLAIHIRCDDPQALNRRIDVMSRLRPPLDFEGLWRRHTSLALGAEQLELQSLPDLVLAKKTQRDKDWPMLSRLVAANYLRHREEPTPERVAFWLRELRDPALLIEAAAAHPQQTAQLRGERPLLTLAEGANVAELVPALAAEESAERTRDREYWLPLRKKLEQLRQAARKGSSD